jgi:hypothetical protein
MGFLRAQPPSYAEAEGKRGSSMRAGVAVSVVGHLGLLLWVFLLFATPKPFAILPAEAITVDVVTAPELEELGRDRGDQAAQPTDSPQNAKQSQNKGSSNPVREQNHADAQPPSGGAEAGTAQGSKPAAAREARGQQGQAPSPGARVQETVRSDTAPPPAPTRPSEPATLQSESESAKRAPQLMVYGTAVAPVTEVPLLPSAGQGGILEPPADTPAGFSSSEAAALKAHMQKCWSFSGGAGDLQNLKAVVRVSLRPNGALAAAPILLEASASAHGPKLVEAALAAVRRCEPYSFLPATKYQEWKILDLHFSPQGLAGG